MQESIIKLEELGQMLDAVLYNPDGDVVDKYDVLLREVKQPISEEEAATLIKLFPASGMYGVEWALLHLVESFAVIEPQKYRTLIALCPSDEWKGTIITHLNNYEKNH